MAPGPERPPWNESTAPPPQHARSLRVRPRSAPLVNGNAQVDVSHQSQPKCRVPIRDSDRTVELSAGGTHLSSSAPTLQPSGFPCSRSLACASFATLLLLTQFLACCIDRLNPPP